VNLHFIGKYTSHVSEVREANRISSADSLQYKRAENLIREGYRGVIREANKVVRCTRYERRKARERRDDKNGRGEKNYRRNKEGISLGGKRKKRINKISPWGRDPTKPWNKALRDSGSSW